MNFFDASTLMWGVLIFCARVLDVSLGTIRTISIVQGRTKTAFICGIFEISLWITVVAKVLNEISQRPLLAIFYALGFSTGNVVGILLERKLAFGHVVLRIISSKHSETLAATLRSQGYAVTTFPGQGMNGPVTLVHIVTLRKELNVLTREVKELAPDAFFFIEPATFVNKLYRPDLLTSSRRRGLMEKL